MACRYNITVATALKRKHEQAAASASSRDQALTKLAILTIEKVRRLELGDITGHAGFLSVGETRRVPLSGISRVADESEETGFLDKLNDAEVGLQMIGKISRAIDAITDELSRIVVNATGKLSSASGAPLSTSAKLAGAGQMAAQFQSPADRLQILAYEFAQWVDKTEPDIRYIFSRMAHNDTDYVTGQEFVVSFGALAAAAAVFSQKLEQWVPMVSPLLEISRSFKKPIKSMVNSFDAINGATKIVGDWNVKVANLTRPDQH